MRPAVLGTSFQPSLTRPKHHCDSLNSLDIQISLHLLSFQVVPDAGCGITARDPFTLQYVAGHDSIKTTMRYVHPREDAVEKLFARLGNLPRPETHVECKRSVQNPVQLEMPSQDHFAKLLITSNLQTAEVVELADTPS